MADAASLEKQLKAIQAVLAPINTAKGEVAFRQFMANGTVAAEKAAAQTSDIHYGGGRYVSLRQVAANGTRAAEQAAAKIAGLEAAIAALATAKQAGGLTAEEITQAAAAGAEQALEKLRLTSVDETAPRAAGAPDDGEDQGWDGDIDGPTFKALAAEVEGRGNAEA